MAALMARSIMAALTTTTTAQMAPGALIARISLAAPGAAAALMIRTASPGLMDLGELRVPPALMAWGVALRGEIGGRGREKWRFAGGPRRGHV